MADIRILDLHFLGLEETISSFLIVTSEGPVLIETGPHSTIQSLESEIKKAGYSLEQIKHVFLTHIHLDHAGAAWYLAQKGAKIYVHPFGAKHLTDPSKLMESARRIYQDKMDYLWGQMEPIPLEQLVEVPNEATFKIGDTTLRAYHTPGHAIHHIAWQIDDVIFTGDVAGVKIGNGPVVPPCPPPDINIEDWSASIELLRQLPVKSLYLTHFGEITEISTHLDTLEEMLHNWAQWIKVHMEQGMDVPTMTAPFQEFVAQGLREKGLSEHQIKQYEAANPSWMSVAGLVRYWTKKNKS